MGDQGEMISTLPKDLWGLVQTRQQIDPSELTVAMEQQVCSGDLDYRTRVLIRDSAKALRNHWGEERFAAWLACCRFGKDITTICDGPWDDDRGFPSLMRRIMDVTRPESVRQFFNDLGRKVRRPMRLEVGGSIALIMPGLLSRKTEDVDVVDEVPAEIRSDHELVHHLKEVHNLELAHFQRHYLPMGWEKRTHYLDAFSQLTVYLVDAYDVFLSKLFSIRVKDRQDLKALVSQLDKEVLIQRLKDSTQSMLAAPDLRQRADDNWTMLYGESLPS